MAKLTNWAGAIVGDPSEVHTTQKNPLGQVVPDENGYEYIYLKGVASTIIYDAVTYNPVTFATTRLVSGAVGPIAVAQAAVLADQYGWFMVRGVTKINNKAAVTINTQMYISGSSGCVDSTYVAGAQVHDCVSVTSSTAVDASGSASVYLHYPWGNAHSDS